MSILDNLVGWFSASLDSSAGDLSDAGNNGTVSGTVAAVRRDGVLAWYNATGGNTSNQLNLSSSFSHARTESVASGKFSISYWVMPDSSFNRRVFGSRQGTDTRLRCGRNSGGNVYAQILQGGSSVLSGVAGNVTAGMVNFTITFDDNIEAKIYADGVEIASDNTVGTYAFGETGGAFAYPDGTFSGGWVDDIKLYDRILTPAEAAEIYTKGRGYDYRVPNNTVLPTLDMGATSWTGTVGSWESQNGTVSYSWQLRLVEDDSVVESGGGSLPQGTGTYDNANGYYLKVDATNTGGTTEARSKVGTLGIGLQVWYDPSLGGGHSDLSGNGNDGTLYNGNFAVVAESTGPGSGTQAFYNSQNAGGIDTGYTSPASSDWTAIAWAKPELPTANGVWSTVMAADSSASPRDYAYMRDSPSNFMMMDVPVSQQSVSYDRDSWSLISITYTQSDTTFRASVNGVQFASHQGSGWSTNLAAWWFGSVERTPGIYPWLGWLDGCRIYDRALSPAEINELYANGRGYDHRPTGLGDEKLWLCPSIEDSANDLSGNGNNGTYNGGMGTVANAEEGGQRAYEFDGVDDYIHIPGLAGQYTTGGSHSTSVWVYQGTVTSQQYFNRHESSSGDRRAEMFWAEATNSRTRAGFKQSTLSLYATANNTNQSGAWYHLTSTYDHTTNTQTIYKNGVSVASQVLSGDSSFSTNYAEIGRASINSGSTQVYSDCKMDDFRSFTRVLTQNEITHLATGRGVTGSPVQGLGDEVAWYCPTLSGNAGDLSGNGNAGTTEGTVTVVEDITDGGKRAYEFDGVDGRINLGTGPNSAFYGDASVSGWMYIDSNMAAADGGVGIIGNNSSSGQWVWYGWEQSPRLTAYSDDGSLNGGALSSGYPFETTDIGWHHIAFSRDYTSNEVKFFVDGALEDTVAFAGTVPNSIAHDLFIGLSGWTSGGGYAGSPTTGAKVYLDDIRVYSRTLTQDEIAHLASDRGVQGTPIVGLGDEKAWYCPSIEDSPRDLTNGGNDGTYNGSMGTIANTEEGGQRAYSFNGTNQDINLGNLGGFANWTCSAWVRPGIVNANQAIVSQWLSTTGNRSLIGPQIMSDGGIRAIISIDGNSNNVSTTSTGSLSASTWYHMATSHDGTTLKVYLDGVEIQSVAAGTARNATSAGEWKIGNLDGSETSWFGGLIDDVRIFERALTDAEIAHLATGRGVLGSAPTGLGDERAWYCPTLSGNASDLSGNGNTGEYNGGMGVTHDTDGTAAFEFDGVDDYINCGVIGWDATQPWTHSAWVQYDYSETTNGQMSKVVSNNGCSSEIYRQSASAVDRIHVHGVAWTGSTQTFSDSTWKHHVWGYDGTDYFFAIDGVRVTVSGSAPTTSGVANNTYIGAENGSTRYMNGLMDDIRIYDRALTSAEIYHLSTERGVTGTPPVGLGDEVAWYCPTLSDSATDLSGNSNDGTYNGGMGTVSDTGAYGLRAFDFDGVDDSVSIAIDPDRSWMPWYQTVTMWIKSSTLANRKYFFGLNGVESQSWGRIGIRKGDSNVQFNDFWSHSGPNTSDGFWVTTTQEPMFNDGEWHHIAYIKTQATEYAGGSGDDISTYLYIDGVLDSSGTLRPNYNLRGHTEEAQIAVGMTLGSFLNVYAEIQMDDIRIYDRALTTTEITHLASERGVQGAPTNGGGGSSPGGTWNNPFQNSFFHNPFFDNEAF